MWFRHGLKAQKPLAQGITLGISAICLAPCKGKSLKIHKDIKNEDKRRIHSPHHFSCRRTAEHLRHHLPAPLWFCSKKPAPRWQRCRCLCRNAPKFFLIVRLKAYLEALLCKGGFFEKKPQNLQKIYLIILYIIHLSK